MRAELKIHVALRGKTTFLKDIYVTPPFKMADVSSKYKVEKLQLVIMSASPGVLDGDEYAVLVSMDPGTSLELRTQSFQRLYQMKKGASQVMEVVLEKNASFYYLPHPLVPHKNALFSSRNKILLSENCTLLWGEVITSGRNLNGERFSFTRLHNITEIYIKEQLVIKENVLLCPGTIELNDVGKMEDFTHQASLIYLNEQAQVEVITNELYMQLQSYQGISFGITAAPVNGLIIRILGYKAEQLFHLLNHIADYLNQTAQIHTISSTNLHTYAN